ncbi:MAG TPA: metallophosphoesterase [Terriglobales bacterium]|nr:metallophosphoesterase [Terriglobales bacterium]
MKRLLLARLFLIVLILVAYVALSPYLHAQVTIVQLSDTHIGLARAPEGPSNLRRAVQLINQRNPDVVIVSGDIGERPSAWDQARDILKGLHAKVYYIPGNHDVHSNDVDRYRQAFGNDYYKFQVKYVTVYMLDSQLWGNWDNFDAHREPPMPPETKSEGEKELAWLNGQAGPGGREDHGKRKGKDKDRDRNDDAAGRGESGVAIAVQHVPAERDHGFPNDPKPYWVVNDPWRGREEDALKKLGVRDVLAGHWHIGKVYNAGGFTWHVAPATSWSPFNGKLGFALHTISPDGNVKTEFVYLDGSTERP